MDETVLESNQKPLLGTDEAVIDTKGRILISKKKRERLGDNFTLVLGLEGCLYAYPEFRWNEILREVFSSESTSEGRQKYTRLVFGTADDELSCDEQGRVVVPHKLKTSANLTKDVVLVGGGDRLEIWDKAEHAAHLDKIYAQHNGRSEAIIQARKEMKAG